MILFWFTLVTFQSTIHWSIRRYVSSMLWVILRYLFIWNLRINIGSLFFRIEWRTILHRFFFDMFILLRRPFSWLRLGWRSPCSFREYFLAIFNFDIFIWIDISFIWQIHLWKWLLLSYFLMTKNWSMCNKWILWCSFIRI